MQTRYVDGVTIRPLRNGDAPTVEALFERLGPRSREQRFAGAKPRLTELELAALTRVDADHHVLVAYLAGDPRPAGIARLVRRGSTAEIACAVADRYQGRGIGSVLTRELAADARAARITELQATVYGDNPRAVSLLARCARALRVSWRGGEREFVVALEPPGPS
jgi:ribosomal protein S18 acetylase RimI-like enzyme